MPRNKGLTVCVLGFCTFAAALTTFHALLLQTVYGPAATFEIPLLSPFTGPIQFFTYFLGSLILICALFGGTSLAVFRYSSELDNVMKLTMVINQNTQQITKRARLLSDKTNIMEKVLRQSLSQTLDSKMDSHTRAIGDKIDGLTARIEKMEEALKIRRNSHSRVGSMSNTSSKPERLCEKVIQLEEVEIKTEDTRLLKRKKHPPVHQKNQ